MNTKLSPKQILIDFIYLRNQLKELFYDNEDYQQIVDFILAKDYLNDELEIAFPKLKEVEEVTGIKNDRVRKLLLRMHNEIFNYGKTINLRFDKTIYQFYGKFYEHSFGFTMDSINHLPKIGEQISIPFVKASIPITTFYVEGIRHEFESDKQIVHISLKVGDNNVYWNFMKDKAKELGEISIMDEYHLSDSELKKKIYSKSSYR
jgi:hypothetical protein